MDDSSKKAVGAAAVIAGILIGAAVLSKPSGTTPPGSPSATISATQFTAVIVG